jgi:flagellar motility protein MotE (MotC chaperone)
MKRPLDIQEKRDFYQQNIDRLKDEIQECLKLQRKEYDRTYSDCDYIKGRNERMAVLEGKIDVLNWILE